MNFASTSMHKMQLKWIFSSFLLYFSSIVFNKTFLHVYCIYKGTEEMHSNAVNSSELDIQVVKKNLHLCLKPYTLKMCILLKIENNSP